MDMVRDRFVAASRRAVVAGFELIELHMAPGSLLGSFRPPVTRRLAAMGQTRLESL